MPAKPFRDPRYRPGNLGQASVLDVLAYAIVQQDSGLPGWAGRADRMREMVRQHFGRVDGGRLILGAEALADQKRGVPNRHYRAEDDFADPGHIPAAHPLIDVELEARGFSVEDLL